MTSPNESSAEMEKLLKEAGEWIETLWWILKKSRDGVDRKDAKKFLDEEFPKLLSYIRCLEQENRRLKTSMEVGCIATLKSERDKYRTQAEVAREAAGEALILRTKVKKLEAEIVWLKEEAGKVV